MLIIDKMEFLVTGYAQGAYIILVEIMSIREFAQARLTALSMLGFI